MLTCYVGRVGSGKTYALVSEAKRAYERGEPVFSNVDIDPVDWDASKGGRIIRWREPIELLAMVDGIPVVRCGLVVFDELGAVVNNRESDYWPYALTLKLIEHRKDHLDWVTSAQDDELADKNVRRFINRVYFCAEWRVPLLGWLRPKSRRPDLVCSLPGCAKHGGRVVVGDRRGWGTAYRYRDVDPRRTQNIEKHNSKAWRSRWELYDPAVATAYGTAGKVSEDAQRWHDRAVAEYNARKFGRDRPRRRE
jgi:hypothetical protein